MLTIKTESSKLVYVNVSTPYKRVLIKKNKSDNKEGAWQVGFGWAKAKDFAGDYPKLSGNGRAGRKQNNLQIYGLRSQLCYHPKWNGRPWGAWILRAQLLRVRSDCQPFLWPLICLGLVVLPPFPALRGCCPGKMPPWSRQVTPAGVVPGPRVALNRSAGLSTRLCHLQLCCPGAGQ